MPDRLTLDAIQSRLDAATPGPWRISPRGHAMGRLWVDDGHQYDVVMTQDQPRQNADADLVAHAPTDIAALLGGITCLEAALRELYEAVIDTQRLKWSKAATLRRALYRAIGALECYRGEDTDV